jgi:hypothetical protein
MRNTTLKLGKQSISYGIRKGNFEIHQISNKGEIYVNITKQKTVSKFKAIIQEDNAIKATLLIDSHRTLLASIARLILPKHREEQFMMKISDNKFFK